MKPGLAYREVGGRVAGTAVVAGQQAGQGGQGPDAGSVSVRRGEQLLGRGAAHDVEQAARGAHVEGVAAKERRDDVAVLAAPVEGRLPGRVNSPVRAGGGLA